MPSHKKAKADPTLLVHKLSVEDARRLLRSEGGDLSPRQFAVELISFAAVWILTARAIWTGGATAWHLALPMAAQYLTLFVALLDVEQLETATPGAPPVTGMGAGVRANLHRRLIHQFSPVRLRPVGGNQFPYRSYHSNQFSFLPLHCHLSLTSIAFSGSYAHEAYRFNH